MGVTLMGVGPRRQRGLHHQHRPVEPAGRRAASGDGARPAPAAGGGRLARGKAPQAGEAPLPRRAPPKKPAAKGEGGSQPSRRPPRERPSQGRKTGAPGTRRAQTMRASLDDIFSDFEQIRQRMTRTWQQGWARPARPTSARPSLSRHRRVRDGGERGGGGGDSGRQRRGDGDLG